MAIIAVVLVVTAEIWVVRSESSPSPFWIWASSSNSRRIQRSKEIWQTGVLQTGNGRVPVWLWFIRQTVHMFFFQVACSSVKNVICWGITFATSLLRVFASTFMRDICLSIFFHVIPLSGLVSGLYWSHKMSWQIVYSTSLLWKRLCKIFIISSLCIW